MRHHQPTGHAKHRYAVRKLCARSRDCCYWVTVHHFTFKSKIIQPLHEGGVGWGGLLRWGGLGGGGGGRGGRGGVFFCFFDGFHRFIVVVVS
jgi:hypothetical protein